MTATEITADDISRIMEDAWDAFHIYRKQSIKQRADLLRSIAKEIMNLGDTLLEIAAKETNLPIERLKSERSRTCFQLESYADACESGQWMDIRIHTAKDNKVDLRKMMVPLGPVVVFGAGNFPFAYSTAGGDTACALAAGCPVIVKGHPAHSETSELVAGAVNKAISNAYLPIGVFSHVADPTFAAGEALVKHYYTKAVGFTGSFSGGKQIFDWANQRSIPVPVYAEMGSVNPVFLLPERTRKDATKIAKEIADSVTLSAGQFCTNPGLIIAIDNDDLEEFIAVLSFEIRSQIPAAMLHTGIYKNFVEKRAAALSQNGVEQIMIAEKPAALNEGTPTIASVNADNFISNPLLQKEVFGPYSLIIRCSDMKEMLEVARHLEGQLTATLMATENDIIQNDDLVECVKNICGRLILNNVPTGVEVCVAMQHGGPFPATTDSRSTSVGADGIKRFARPVTFQNWSENLLPEELKNSNRLKIWRTVNNQLTDLAL